MSENNSEDDAPTSNHHAVEADIAGQRNPIFLRDKSLSLDDSCLAIDADAARYFQEHGCDNVPSCFQLANILHTHGNVREASEFYRRGFDFHDKNPGHYPLAQSLLQASLLCMLKAGFKAPEDEIRELEAIAPSHANYIRGVQKAWREGGDINASLRIIGNAFEDFHTGEEIDLIYLGLAKDAEIKVFSEENTISKNVIPKNLFFFWDSTSPPPEVAQNIEFHQNLEGIDVTVFNKDMGAAWLYDYYGREAQTIFLEARHPAEAADFLRVHVIHLLGGWWLDADIRVKPSNTIPFMHAARTDLVFFLTYNNVVHNDFFGSVPGTDTLGDCLLSLYRNSFYHKNLFIAYKTGPGVFNRAISRAVYKNLCDIECRDSIRLYSHNEFNEHIEEFETPYKHYLPSWYTA